MKESQLSHKQLQELVRNQRKMIHSLQVQLTKALESIADLHEQKKCLRKAG